MADMLVLIDGECNLCSGWVHFVRQRLSDKRLKFLSLQSEAGRALLNEHGFGAHGVESVVFFEDGGVYVRSDAILRISRYMRRPWPAVAYLLVFPRKLRNLAYASVAANRYRWFGRTDTCAAAGKPEPSRHTWD